jgi:hypothetical protein
MPPKIGCPKISNSIAPLCDIQIRNAKPKSKPYKLFDGGGLYIEVLPSASKFWRMKFRQASGKESRLSFGPYPEVSLSEARRRRGETRALRRNGSDPAQVRRAEKIAVNSKCARLFF